MAIDNTLYHRDADFWWDKDGYLQLLNTAINPARFAYFSGVLNAVLSGAPYFKKVLDVGCGGGALCESFAKLGCSVIGIDRSRPTIDAARRHARRCGLSILYRQAEAEKLPFADETFAVVSCCDMLEHVDKPSQIIKEAARVLQPGGLLFFDTINRGFSSRLIVDKIAQQWSLTRIFPKQMHDWRKFIKPAELAALMTHWGISPEQTVGLSPPYNYAQVLINIFKLKLGTLSFAQFGNRVAFRRSPHKSISYMGYGVKK